MVHKLTIDGGLLRQQETAPAIQMLKTWGAQGKLELFESDQPKDQGTFQSARLRTVRQKNPNGLTFQQLAGVLFPGRDPIRLNMREINDIVHLQQHHLSGRSMFVTDNTQDFISAGKRERLRTGFNIVVLTPEEAVSSLKQSESQTTGEFEMPSSASKRGIR